MALKKRIKNGYKPDLKEFRYHHKFRKHLAEAAEINGETISALVGATRKERSDHKRGCEHGFLRGGK